ncbi:MAG: DUF5610 domain-containing protein [Oceanicoccus sp.]
MNITSFLNGSPNSLQLPSSRSNDKPVSSSQTPAAAQIIDLSDGGKNLLENFQQQTNRVPLAYQAIPVGQRPSSQQSADTILNFISGRLEALASSGADNNAIENAYNQAVKGFQQGLQEAKDILQGVQMMSDDVNGGIDVTERLVNEGLAALREQFISGNQPQESTPQLAPAAVSKVVKAYQQQSTEVNRYSENTITGNNNSVSDNLRATASAYAESYRRNDSVELSVRTLDGDLVTLSFSSAIATDRSASLTGIQSAKSSAAMLTYQRSASVSSNFSLSVKGELDSGEIEALNSLLAEVSALSDEFFSGDFDKAFELAMNFQMDGSEFSAMALDITRNTRASITESYAAVSGQQSGQSTLASNAEDLESLVERLLAMIEKASNFNNPQKLFADVLANQIAQKFAA